MLKSVHAYFTEEMKEDYDTMGPEAAIQTTGNNGTGKMLCYMNISSILNCWKLAVHEEKWWQNNFSWLHFNSWETFT